MKSSCQYCVGSIVDRTAFLSFFSVYIQTTKGTTGSFSSSKSPASCNVLRTTTSRAIANSLKQQESYIYCDYTPNMISSWWSKSFRLPVWILALGTLRVVLGGNITIDDADTSITYSIPGWNARSIGSVCSAYVSCLPYGYASDQECVPQ